MIQTRTVIDQMGRPVEVSAHPRRIVSLVPSQTELLFHLGLDEEIVGVTRYCVHPVEALQSKTNVGGAKDYRFEVIDRLQPDLIVGNKEENEQEGILRLAASYPVWMSDVHTMDDALWMIRAVGALVGRGEEADRLVRQIEAAFGELKPLSRPSRVAYFIWQKPYIVVGHDTFIDHMLGRCGLKNVFAQPGDSRRYFEVTLEQVREAGVEAVLLSSEPFPFKEKHRPTFAEVLPGVAITLVDGEMFSWYGSRLLLAAPYLADLLAEMG